MPKTHDAIAPPTVFTEFVSPVATPGLVRGRRGRRGSRERGDEGARADARDDHVREHLHVAVVERQEQQVADATSELAPMSAMRGVTHRVASGNSIAPTTSESTYDADRAATSGSSWRRARSRTPTASVRAKVDSGACAPSTLTPKRPAVRKTGHSDGERNMRTSMSGSGCRSS